MQRGLAPRASQREGRGFGSARTLWWPMRAGSSVPVILVVLTALQCGGGAKSASDGGPGGAEGIDAGAQGDDGSGGAPSCTCDMSNPPPCDSCLECWCDQNCRMVCSCDGPMWCGNPPPGQGYPDASTQGSPDAASEAAPADAEVDSSACPLPQDVERGSPCTDLGQLCPGNPRSCGWQTVYDTFQCNQIFNALAWTTLAAGICDAGSMPEAGSD